MTPNLNSFSGGSDSLKRLVSAWASGRERFLDQLNACSFNALRVCVARWWLGFFFTDSIQLTHFSDANEWITYHSLMHCVMSICEQECCHFHASIWLAVDACIYAECIGNGASAEICQLFDDDWCLKLIISDQAGRKGRFRRGRVICRFKSICRTTAQVSLFIKGASRKTDRTIGNWRSKCVELLTKSGAVEKLGGYMLRKGGWGGWGG